MKNFTVVAFLFFQFSIFAQTEKNDSLMLAVETRFQKLDHALIVKDVPTLQNLLHENLTLGHSNAWLETKPDLLKNLRDGRLIYKSIETIGVPRIFHQTENLITARRNIDVQGTVEGFGFKVKLNILGIWVFEQGRWQLLARQSVDGK